MSEYLVPITVARLKEGQYLATSPILQGLVAQGRTVAETLEIAEDVARKLIESCLEHNDPLPLELSRISFGKKRRAKISFTVPVPVES